jgi:hypothetical protein
MVMAAYHEPPLDPIGRKVAVRDDRVLIVESADLQKKNGSFLKPNFGALIDQSFLLSALARGLATKIYLYR